MMYIFEGVDHSGKDTLIKALLKYRQENNLLVIPVFNGLNVYDRTEFPHISKSIKVPAEWQKAISFEVVNFVRQIEIDVIVNRFTWSEIVYGHVIRKGVERSFYIDVMLKELEDVAKIIYVDCDTEEIVKRLEESERKKSSRIIEKIADLRRAYERLVDNSKIPVIYVDSSERISDRKNYLMNPEALERLHDEIFGR